MTETDDVGVAATNDFADPSLQFFLIHFGKTLQMKRLRWSSKT